LGRVLEPFPVSRLHIHRDDREKFLRYLNLLYQPGPLQVSLEIRLFPFSNNRVSEHVKYVHCGISKIMYQGKSAAVITMVDTTRVKELERLVQLREKMVSLGHVAAGIAHEIRNPLSGINILLDGIKENFQDPDSAGDIQELIFEAQKASDKIAAVVKRVLDFSRPHRPHLSLSDIQIPLKEALNLSKTGLRKSRISLHVKFSETLPFVYIDVQLIEQVVLNIISNAIEAMRQMTDEKHLEIVSVQENGSIVVSIADSGPGIPKDIRKKIFEPFYTSRSDGSGIGLSLCQRFIGDLGGTIEIYRSKWGGAEFRIKIPLEKRMNPR
jgi:signal transduction histidine kinase